MQAGAHLQNYRPTEAKTHVEDSSRFVEIFRAWLAAHGLFMGSEGVSVSFMRSPVPEGIDYSKKLL